MFENSGSGNVDNIHVQWFPGHMTKTNRNIKEDIRLVDAVAEIADARIPISSRNPDLKNILHNKPHVLLLNKCDLADRAQTEKWVNYYKQNGTECIAIDCQSGKGLKSFMGCIDSILREKIDRWKSKGMIGKLIKVMVVGIPNVGKSTFINRMSGGSKARVEDRPGVTRGNQWFTVENKLEMLDTPGVLWPKFEDKNVGMNLAFTGAVKDTVIDIEELAVMLIEVLKKDYLVNISERYKLNANEIANLNGFDILNLIGKKRGMLMAGGKIDLMRVSTMVMDEFRAGKIGNITLEKIEEGFMN